MAYVVGVVARVSVAALTVDRPRVASARQAVGAIASVSGLGRVGMVVVRRVWEGLVAVVERANPKPKSDRAKLVIRYPSDFWYLPRRCRATGYGLLGVSDKSPTEMGRGAGVSVGLLFVLLKVASIVVKVGVVRF